MLQPHHTHTGALQQHHTHPGYSNRHQISATSHPCCSNRFQQHQTYRQHFSNTIHPGCNNRHQISATLYTHITATGIRLQQHWTHTAATRQQASKERRLNLKSVIVESLKCMGWLNRMGTWRERTPLLWSTVRLGWWPKGDGQRV